MSDEIRFAKLVGGSGHPETFVPWTEPMKNAVFKRAVKENRVLTVAQNPTSHKKDFGQIGFHNWPFASFLIFPKALPRRPEARVIGVKYELIEEREPKVAASAKELEGMQRKVAVVKKSERPEKVGKREGMLKKFVVVVECVARVEQRVAVEARNAREARRSALESGEEVSFAGVAVERRVKAVKGVV